MSHEGYLVVRSKACLKKGIVDTMTGTRAKRRSRTIARPISGRGQGYYGSNEGNDGPSTDAAA